MSAFRHGHATHPQWSMAMEIALTQAMGREGPIGGGFASGLGLLYVTDAFAPHLGDLLAALRARTGVHHWSGAVAASICGGSAEYAGEPALAIMIASLPAESFRVFSGRLRATGAGGPAHVALVHADPRLPDIADLLAELADRTDTGFLFGALTSGADDSDTQLADEPVRGGLSGVAFDASVRLLTRVTQGCAPLAGEHRISECTGQFLQQLDGRPALDVLLEDLGVRLPPNAERSGPAILQALPMQRLRQGLFVGLASGEGSRSPGFGDYLVRSVVGIDPSNRVVAVGDTLQSADRAVFCTRDRDAARRDLVRIIAELRDEVDDEGLEIRGALYHSCVARGSHLFGAPGAEMELIRHHLGEVPLIGMYGNGEIARDRIYGHTGVLTLFVA